VKKLRFKSDKQRAAVMAKLRYIAAPPLQSANRLPVQVGIVVPSKVGTKYVGPKRHGRWVDSEKRWFDKKFQGDTSVKSLGTYLEKKKGKPSKLVKERGVIVESSTTVANYNKYRQAFARHAIERQKEWKQSSMLVFVEGQKFITPKQDYLLDDKRQSKKVLVT
jgi:hypothetical protein